MHYYNGARTHLFLNKDAPLPRAVQAVGRILPTPILGGLHHHYVRFDFRQRQPALVGLALDVSLAGFALGVEGVEGEIEIMLGRFVRVDRAALRLGSNRFHAAPLRCWAQGRALIDPDRGANLGRGGYPITDYRAHALV
jgi:hypothetical protein